MSKKGLVLFSALALLLLGVWAADSIQAGKGKSSILGFREADVAPASERLTSSVPPSSGSSEALGDSIWGFDSQGPSGDNHCLGIEFDGTNFYVSGGNSGSDPNKIHIFDSNGNYLSTFDQFRSSAWGWRDLAWDGNHLYGSDDGMVTEFGTDGTDYGDFPGPENPNRALAYDPATGHFWTANWGSPIYEFDTTGAVVNQYTNTYSIYGMAWDTLSVGGPWLWVAAQSPDMIYQFDPLNGVYTGVSFPATGIAGGCAFSEDWNPLYGILFYVAQSTPDHVIAYEITYTPWDHDVGVQSIDSPATGIAPDTAVTPQATVKNWGLNTETFDVTCRVDSSATTVYADTQTVDTLASGATQQVTFTDWTPDGPGNVYDICVYTALAGDEFPANDTLCMTTMTYSYYEDFEASDGGYTPDPPTGAWEWGAPTSGPGGAHSGVNVWATVLADNYSNNADWRLHSGDFTAIIDDPALEFWHWYDTESGYDGGNVKVSTDFGATWQIVTPVGGYPDVAHPTNAGIPNEPCYAGNSGGWQLTHFDLAGITNGTFFRRRWHFGSDGSVIYPGWYVDDAYGFGFEPTIYGALEGTVTDFNVGDSLQGAVVTSLTTGFSDTTDANGYYYMDVPPTSHDLRAEALGYNFLDTTGIGVVSAETTTVDFALRQFGGIAGTVTDLATGVSIQDALVTSLTAGVSDTTDINGYYFIEVPDAAHDMRVEAYGYTTLDTTGIVVTGPGTTTADFALGHPDISIYPAGFRVGLLPDHVVSTCLWIYNTGNGRLDFNIEVWTGGMLRASSPAVKVSSAKSSGPACEATDVSPSVDRTRPDQEPPGGWSEAFGDSIWGLDCEAPTDDNQCLGVEFDGDYFYITGGGGTSHPDPNKLHFFDHDGNYLSSVDQGTPSGWGWRDIAYDGIHMYSSCSGVVDEWYVTGLPGSPVLNNVGSFSGPENPNRALAWDPATDHFWTGNFSGPIYEFDRTGMVHNTFGNTYDIYGMAWDDVSEYAPCLWIAEQSTPAVRQFDPVGGVYTGLWFPISDIAGGSALTTDWDPSLVVLFQLLQTAPDHVVAHEIGIYQEWLDVDPESSSVAAGDTFHVSVIFNSTGLAMGRYIGELRIHNNSVSTPIVVPCTLDVYGFGLEEAADLLDGPKVYSLSQNAPNPVNGSTVINYQLPAKSEVSLRIYNTSGRLVRSLVDETLEPGYYGAIWDGRDSSGRRVSSGVYFYRLSAGDFVDSRKMVLLK